MYPMTGTDRQTIKTDEQERTECRRAKLLELAVHTLGPVSANTSTGAAADRAIALATVLESWVTREQAPAANSIGRLLREAQLDDQMNALDLGQFDGRTEGGPVMTDPSEEITTTTRQLSPEEIEDLFGEEIDVGATVVGARRMMAEHYGLAASDEELEHLAVIGKANGLGFEGMTRVAVKIIDSMGKISLVIDEVLADHEMVKQAAWWAPIKADVQQSAWRLTRPGLLDRHMAFASGSSSLASATCRSSVASVRHNSAHNGATTTARIDG